jgi:hypothetical protein
LAGDPARGEPAPSTPFACIEVSPTACSQPRLPTPSIVAANVCATDSWNPVCRRCDTPASAVTCHCARAGPETNTAIVARPAAAPPERAPSPKIVIRTRPGFPPRLLRASGFAGSRRRRRTSGEVSCSPPSRRQ